MLKKTEKKVIGRIERVTLPGFGLNDIEAKIDTGAYSGSIHISDAHEEKEDGLNILKFTLLDEERPEYNGKEFVSTNFDKKVVKNSIGESEVRYFIPVTIILKNKKLDVKIGLSNRKEMRYPVLIGRKIIKNHFVVDAAKKITK